MKKCNVKIIKQYILDISERVYLCLLTALIAYYILYYSNTEVNWDTLGQGIPVVETLARYLILEPYVVLGIIAALRFVCCQKIKKQEIIFAALIFLVSKHAVAQNRYTEVYVMMLLMLGAKGISFGKLIKTYFITALSVVGGVFLLSLTGIIENLVYTPVGRSIRMSFGFSYPTRFAAHVFFLLLWYWFLRGRKLTKVEAGLPLLMGLFVWEFCNARLSAACLCLLSLVMFYQIFRYCAASRNRKEYRMYSGISSALALAVPIATLVITVLTMAYNQNNLLFQKLDSILSERLYLTKKTMDIYGFCLWGQWIRLSGGGGYLVSNPKYFYIDSAFLQFSIQYGIILLLLLMCLFWYVGVRAKKEGQWILLWIIGFVALHGMFEPHTLRVGYCPLIFGVFASFSTGKERHDP